MNAEPARLRIAYVPGVTLTKWMRVLAERRPEVAVELVQVAASDQILALREGRADVGFVRSQTAEPGLSLVPLYKEVAVVVAPKEHPLAAFDSVTLAELAGERLQDVAGSVPDALELVAAGVGIAILPQSVARLHARRDLITRPVSDGEETPIAFAWLSDGAGELVEEFLGIVRGRTARSSRSAGASVEEKPQKKVQPRPAKAGPSAAVRARAAAAAKSKRRRGR